MGEPILEAGEIPVISQSSPAKLELEVFEKILNLHVYQWEIHMQLQ